MDKTELKCLGALYGNLKTPSKEEIDQSILDKARRSGESEYSHQRKLHYYLKSSDILHFAPMNEGKRSEREAEALKRLGLTPGVPDVWILIPRKPYHGLIIELKQEERGIVSGAQQWWLKELNRASYRAVVSWYLEQSIEIVQDYLSLPSW